MHRLVIALTALLGLTGAAVVTISLLVAGLGTDRLARLAPADSALYVNLYLQPSSGQRTRLEALARRLPGFADAASLDDKIDQMAQNLLGQIGLDYRADIKPWLGPQLAFAADASQLSSTEPAGVLLAAVRDRAAAEAALARRATDADPAEYQGVTLQVSPDTTLALLDDALVVGGTREAVEEVIDVSRGAPSLAEAPAFRAAADRLPADNVGTIHVDLTAIAGVDVTAATGFSVLAGAVVLEEDGVRLAGTAPFDAEQADEAARAAFALGAEPSSLVDWMPADTQAEVVVFGVRQALEAAESAAATAPGGDVLTDALAGLRTLAAFGLGIDLDADVLPLLDGEVALAITGLDTGMPHGQLLMRPSDPAEAADLVDRLTDRLQSSGASVSTQQGGRADITVVELPGLGTVAYALVDGIVIAGLGAGDVEAAIAAHDGGASLAATDAYQRAFALAGDRAGNEAWIDVAPLMEVTGVADALVPDARDILDRINALGITAPSRDDALEIRAALTVE